MEKLNKNNFIILAKQKYGDKYDYSKVEYTNSNTNVCIICPTHGEFYCTPSNHIYNNRGCMQCKKDLKKLDFIEKAKQIHNNIYDYTKVQYINNHTKVCIICKEHGEFWQTPSSHLIGCGCPKCVNKNITTEEFITRAKQIHGDKYDYSKVVYVNSQTKVCIICPIHGEFWVTPNNHIVQKHSCPKCSHRSYKYTYDEFIARSKEIHGDKYDYSKVQYINSKTKVCIICKEHGEFWQTPYKHISGQGCPFCRINKKLTKDEFVKRAKEVHNDKYDYSKVEYVNYDTKVCIICPIHGEFWQTPHSHMSGSGCKICSQENNINETRLFNFLQNNLKTEIERCVKLDFLNGKSVDIYMPQYKIAIEYQGIQHFEPIKYFGGKKRFDENVKRDVDKYNECKENNVKLFYFSKEKKIPKNYIDMIFINENDLLNVIKNYANNERNTRLI